MAKDSDFNLRRFSRREPSSCRMKRFFCVLILLLGIFSTSSQGTYSLYKPWSWGKMRQFAFCVFHCRRQAREFLRRLSAFFFFCGRKCMSHSRFPTMHIVLFSFTATGCYVVFTKAKLCSFSFKISLRRARAYLRLSIITHRCFTLTLRAARWNTDKICYDEGTMVLSTRVSSLSVLSSCLGTYWA